MAEEKILLAHGSGGRLTHDLIRQVFLPRFSNPLLDILDDSAKIHHSSGPLRSRRIPMSSIPSFSPAEILRKVGRLRNRQRPGDGGRHAPLISVLL